MTKFIYNNAVHSATSYFSFFLNYDANSKFFIDIIKSNSSKNEKVRLKINHLKLLHEEITQRLAKMNKQYAKYYDKHHTVSKIFIEDKVFLLDKNVSVDRFS